MTQDYQEGHDNDNNSRNEFPEVKGIDTCHGSGNEADKRQVRRNEFPEVKGIDTPE